MDWHARYLQQAAWTRQLRSYLFQKTQLASARRILEIGCGTGAILKELATERRETSDTFSVHGLDVSHAALRECRLHVPAATLTQGDAHALPYPDHIYDIAFCHFLLLWLKDPPRALREMKRVTSSGGHVIVMAEPDHRARIDAPAELAALGAWQTEALSRQGADTGIGARIAGLCRDAGIRIIEAGVMEPRAEEAVTPVESALEWEVLKADLEGIVSHSELEALRRLDLQARHQGRRVLHVPTYYVWGQV